MIFSLGFVVPWVGQVWKRVHRMFWGCFIVFPSYLCRPLAKKWSVMLILGTCLLYCSRMTMPICVVSMAESFHWSKIDSGIVLGGFFWGYCFTQILGGHASDRWAARSASTRGLKRLCVFKSKSPIFHQTRRGACPVHFCLVVVRDHRCDSRPCLSGPSHPGSHDVHQIPDGVTAG